MYDIEGEYEIAWQEANETLKAAWKQNEGEEAEEPLKQAWEAHTKTKSEMKREAKLAAEKEVETLGVPAEFIVSERAIHGDVLQYFGEGSSERQGEWTTILRDVVIDGLRSLRNKKTKHSDLHLGNVLVTAGDRGDGRRRAGVQGLIHDFGKSRSDQFAPGFKFKPADSFADAINFTGKLQDHFYWRFTGKGREERLEEEKTFADKTHFGRRIQCVRKMLFHEKALQAAGVDVDTAFQTIQAVCLDQDLLPPAELDPMTAYGMIQEELQDGSCVPPAAPSSGPLFLLFGRSRATRFCPPRTKENRAG